MDFCEICSLSAGSPLSLLGRSDLRGLTCFVVLQESHKFRKNPFILSTNFGTDKKKKPDFSGL
jgi:hypothetical protein